MAINWLFALKAVPWTDLVQAAPSIVKGARKLYSSVRGGSAEPVHQAGSAQTEPAASGVEGRIQELEQRVATLADEQQASAEIIRNLAEQNARLIEAVSIMRARARIVFGACIVSWVGAIVLTIWVVTR